jgi:hypothetical protein
LQSEDGWDLRQVYLGYLANGHDPVVAAGRLIERFQPDQLSPGATFWPALAAVQVEAGRLTEGIRRRALDVIESGSATAAWERAGARAAEVRRHGAALVKLRAEIERPAPSPVELPRPLTARKRIQAMMMPYWRKLTPQAQRVAVELGQPPPRDLGRLRAFLASIPPDQAWLAASQEARTLRWQQAFADDVVAESRKRLAEQGVPEDAIQRGADGAGMSQAVRDDLLRLAHFLPQRDELVAFRQALWQFVNDGPLPLRPPSYPESLRRT